MRRRRPAGPRGRMYGHSSVSLGTGHRVVVIGAGFGGLFALRALRRGPVDVTVIDRTNHHLFQPLLYQMATGILSSGEIAPPIRDVLRRYRNTTVLLGDVTAIDLRTRTVTAHVGGTGHSIPYDSLIVAAGAVTSYFGHDELSRWAPGMKSIDDALELRGRIFGAFEMAELESDPVRQGEWLTFAVVGAGPTGVEMAGQIIELSRRALRGNFRRIDPRTARVLLFDGATSVLGDFGPRLSDRTLRDLGRLGVEVHLGSIVRDVDDRGITVEGADGARASHAARTVIWAAGVRASPLTTTLAQQSGAALDRSGRIAVAPDCSLPGHPEVFVIGDMMALDDLPGMAEVAMQSGRHAARTILRRTAGELDGPGAPLRYRDLGTMATISRFRGIAKIGPLRLSGVVGWLAWLVVHLTFLTGFKNRLSALAHWTVSFLGRSRAERTITEQQIVARVAIDATRKDSER